jgi:hypothetical protein
MSSTSRIGWSSLAIFASASAVSDLCPIATGASAGDAGGRLAEGPTTLGLLPPWLGEQLSSWEIHSAASVVAGAALVLAIGALTTEARAHAAGAGQAARSILARLGRWLMAVQASAIAWLGLAVVAHAAAGSAGRVELTGEACSLVSPTSAILMSSYDRSTVTVSLPQAMFPAAEELDVLIDLTRRALASTIDPATAGSPHVSPPLAKG